MGKVICHDGTPFCDFRCSNCGFVMHAHQSELPPNYRELELRTFCKNCGAELVLPDPIWIGEEGA